MTRDTGNMLDILKKEGDGLLLFTGNSVVNDGRLVMGAGVAKEIRTICPSAPRVLGSQVMNLNAIGVQYGVLIYEHDALYINGTRIGAFQTKIDWRNPSTLALIGYSTQSLLDHLNHYPGTTRVDMNYPGIGLGGLRMEDVAPIISILPDIVHVWTRR